MKDDDGMGYPLSKKVDDVLQYEDSGASKSKQAIGEDGLGIDDTKSQVIKRIYHIKQSGPYYCHVVGLDCNFFLKLSRRNCN